MTEITEDTDTITIGQRQLTADLDLYVANGNPDISPNFSTIQNALNYLGQWIIPTTIRARINVSAGEYISPDAIVVDHAGAQSITIQGPVTNTVAGTSVTITGSASNWSLRVNGISDTSQFVVNKWAIINVGNATSGNQTLLHGFFRVTAVAASSVTVLVPNPKASFSVTGTTTVAITPINAILKRSLVNGNVVNIGAYGIRLFQYIGVLPGVQPTLAMNAVFIGGSSNLVSVGIAGFNMAFNTNADNLQAACLAAGTCHCDACAVSNNQHGFMAGTGGHYLFRGCAFSYNNNIGLYLEGGSARFIYEASHLGGNYRAMHCAGNGSIGLVATVPPAYVLVEYNDHWGLLLYSGGSLTFSSTACILNMYQNGLSQPTHYDVVAQNYGLASGSVCITGSRIFNSPVGVIKITGGLIN